MANNSNNRDSKSTKKTPADPSVATPAPADNLHLPELSEAGKGEASDAVSSQDAPTNLEPLTPVAPASGWLDSDAPPPTPKMRKPLSGVESSNIFANRRNPGGRETDQSDVIAATAGPSTPGQSGKPPSGSKSSGGGSSSLPVAEELADSGRLFDEPISELPFDQSKLVDTPAMPPRRPPTDASDYGATPELTPDASSILADLTEQHEPRSGDSSAVRVEAPGIGRTLRHDPEGTEFDLTVSSEAVPPELEAASSEANVGKPTWKEPDGSDLFATSVTEAEVALTDSGRLAPVDPKAKADDPSSASASSIFSGAKPPKKGGSSKSGGSDVPLARMDEEDASVEFSAHPQAEDEEASSRIFGPKSPAPKPPQIRKPTPKPRGSSAAFDLPPVAGGGSSSRNLPAEGMIDWNAADSDDMDALSGPHSKTGGPVSAILRGKGQVPSADDQPTLPNRGTSAAKSGKHPPASGKKSDPSVEIDWMAGSSSESPALPGSATRGAVDAEAPTREARMVSSRTPSGKGGWIGGVLIGLVMSAIAFAGAYFGGLIPKGETVYVAQQGQQPPGRGQIGTIEPPPSAQAFTSADMDAAIRAGDPAKAKKIAATLNDSTPTGKALQGTAQLFVLIQESANAPIAADNPELKAARENLQALIDDAASAKTAGGEKAAAQAAIHLGLTYQLAGDTASAKKVYEDAKAKFHNFAATFDSALDRLAATAPPPSDGTSIRYAPAEVEHLLLLATMIQADPVVSEEPEAGVFFWKAVTLANGGKYTEAIEQIGKAKAAHIKQAKALAGRGLNPLSDPLEQIFTRSCDDLKAYWELRAAIYSNKSIADLIKKDGAEKALTELAAAQQKAIEAVKLATDLKAASDKLAKATTDLKKAETDLKKAESDGKQTKDLVAKLEKDVKDAGDAKIAIEKKLDVEEKGRKKSDDLLTGVAKELQAAKLLPEKFDTADLLAAQKKAITRANLASSELIDIADRLTKSEAAAKAAADKHVADLKKLADSHVADQKKLMDAFAAETSKLKDSQTTELKKAADKYKTDMAKLTDEHLAAMKKLTDEHDRAIAGLALTVKDQKAKIDAITAQFKTDLGNAISPTEALDLWLPLLVELRRASDADPALATATKVIGSAAPDTEDAGKARTVAGRALLSKGDLPKAKEMFRAARANPAHAPALEAKKLWARAANMGLASIDDPLATYRQPLESSKRDPAVAARFLDAGINAYKAGRYDDAVTALTDSTKSDSTDPLAWYFLGAAKWSLGHSDQAKDDFRQGSEREKTTALSPRTINDILTPIQGPARDALTAARP